MPDLDTLRPEVREAINRTDMTVEMFDTLVTVNRDDYDTIRAELLRLAKENVQLRDNRFVLEREVENLRNELEAVHGGIP